MTLRDDFGIVSRNEALRLRYGNRTSHGKVATPPWERPIVAPAELPPPPPVRKPDRVMPKKVAPAPPHVREDVKAAKEARKVANAVLRHVLAAASAVSGYAPVTILGGQRTLPILRARMVVYGLMRERCSGISRASRARAMGRDSKTLLSGEATYDDFMKDETFVYLRAQVVAVLDSGLAPVLAACQQEHTGAFGKSPPSCTG